MIKGVNKRIIEINNPDSIYFEKAVFYLRPCVREFPDTVAKNEADRYISHLGLETYPILPRRKHKGKIIFLLTAAIAAVGILLPFLL